LKVTSGCMRYTSLLIPPKRYEIGI